MTLTDALRSWLASKVAPPDADPQALIQYGGSWSSFLSGPPAASGFRVTPETSMKLSAVYRCATLIAGAVQTLPLPIYKDEGGGVRRRLGKTDLWYLLNEAPCPGWTAATFWEFMLLSMQLRGDGFARLVVNNRNEPVEIRPLHPQDVMVEQTRAGLRYAVRDLDEKVMVDEAYMLHFPMPGFDGCRSPSIIQHAAQQTIGTSLRTEDHAARLFESGAANRVALEYPTNIKPEDAQALRDNWLATYGDGNDPRRVPLVLTGGAKASTISLTAADAQLLESRRFHVEDICRAFGVPPWMVGAMDKQTSWGSGVEQAGIGFVTYTLAPHLHRMENELNKKLFRRAGPMVEFVVDGLLRGDMKARSDSYRQGVGGSNGPGYLTVNEVRAKENLPPITGGDVLYNPATAGAGASNANQPPGAGA